VESHVPLAIGFIGRLVPEKGPTSSSAPVRLFGVVDHGRDRSRAEELEALAEARRGRANH
jgi:hypothetical protein